MKVLFFAQTRDAAGCAEYFLQVKRTITQAEFWALLSEVFPRLIAHHATARLARSGTYLPADDSLHPADEIAVLPPMSGG